MTTEETRDAAKVMEAYANGKKIQYLNDDNEWIDTSLPLFNWAKHFYRVKPEPKYRPFKTQEECWKEMLKHQPFAFLSSANEYDWFSICRVFEEEGIPKITFASNPYSDYDMAKVFDTFQFADGTPFGIKEE